MNSALNRPAAPEHEHYGVLDGWRGISILLVLWGHWFPAGPRGSGMNEALALTGMALFFTLSGFLITTFLHQRPNVREFLIRRLFRIVPLAWLFSAVVLLVLGVADVNVWAAHLLFYGNLPPFPLQHATSHLWSLCVEMHFYVGVAILVGLVGRRALYALPLLCVAVTGLRIAQGELENIVTWYRLDEILTGATLALVRLRWAGKFTLPYAMPLLLLLAVLLLASGNPHSGPLNYLRGYFASLLVGVTLYCAEGVVLRVLQGRVLAYIAKVSYALYVLHGGLGATWLGSGEGIQKYLKRPLLAAATFALAHLSTFTYEARAQALGRSLARRWAARSPA
jgi:peptidoglycan/LPS O-acetylase OafA/YrhL